MAHCGFDRIQRTTRSKQKNEPSPSREVASYTGDCPVVVVRSQYLLRCSASAKPSLPLARIRQVEVSMKSYTVVVERCPETGLYVGSVPGFPGAHSQGESLDELRENMREVIAMLLEDGEPTYESEFVGTETVEVS